VRLVYAAVGFTEGTARSAEAERFPPGELVATTPLLRKVEGTGGTARYPRMTSRTGVGWSEYASLE
jgi:hypothetical protein